MYMSLGDFVACGCEAPGWPERGNACGLSVCEPTSFRAVGLAAAQAASPGASAEKGGELAGPSCRSATAVAGVSKAGIASAPWP